MDLVHLFLQFALLGAAWVLWICVALSVLSIGVMIDRALWMRGKDTDTERFCKDLRAAYDRGEIEHFEKKFASDTSVPVQVALCGLQERDRGPDAAAEAMQAEKSKWRKNGDKNLIILGTLGNNVPFIGLFGTVLGIIKAFDDLKSKSAEAESAVMGSIAEALVATAVGLLVAIPAVIAFNYFSRRLKVVLASADECAHTVMALIYGTRDARASAAKDA
jgi:biopolymer transport protein ExbB/TolQ